MKIYVKSSKESARYASIEKSVRKALDNVYYLKMWADDTYASEHSEIVSQFLQAYSSDSKLTYPQFIYIRTAASYLLMKLLILNCLCIEMIRDGQIQSLNMQWNILTL